MALLYYHVYTTKRSYTLFRRTFNKYRRFVLKNALTLFHNKKSCKITIIFNSAPLKVIVILQDSFVVSLNNVKLRLFLTVTVKKLQYLNWQLGLPLNYRILLTVYCSNFKLKFLRESAF